MADFCFFNWKTYAIEFLICRSHVGWYRASVWILLHLELSVSYPHHVYRCYTSGLFILIPKIHTTYGRGLSRIYLGRGRGSDIFVSWTLFRYIIESWQCGFSKNRWVDPKTHWIRPWCTYIAHDTLGLLTYSSSGS